MNLHQLLLNQAKQLEKLINSKPFDFLGNKREFKLLNK